MSLPRLKPMVTKARLRPVSRKRAKYHASPEGQAAKAYMAQVKMLPCCICGSHPPNDAHHCRDRPPENEQELYTRLSGAGMKSHAYDTIPLCRAHHTDGSDAYHRGPETFRQAYGPDYQFIGPTRAAIAAQNGEIDF